MDAAAAAIRRVIGETTAPAARAGRLPAYIEIMIAAGSLELRAPAAANSMSFDAATLRGAGGDGGRISRGRGGGGETGW